METARPASTAGEDVVARAGTVIRRAAERLGASGVLDREELRRFRAVPAQLQRAGSYLERRQLRGVKLDAERGIVARPLVALLVAAVVGWVAGRAIRS